MFAVYYDHATPSGVTLRSVMLTDGAWTSPRNCYMREFGVTWHIPRLFDAHDQANDWMSKNLAPLLCYRIGEYNGPTEPWDRPEK